MKQAHNHISMCTSASSMQIKQMAVSLYVSELAVLKALTCKSRVIRKWDQVPSVRLKKVPFNAPFHWSCMWCTQLLKSVLCWILIPIFADDNYSIQLCWCQQKAKEYFQCSRFMICLGTWHMVIYSQGPKFSRFSRQKMGKWQRWEVPRVICFYSPMFPRF